MTRMPWNNSGLISQIQTDALDDQTSITAALRKCLVLGGESGSSQLLHWATHELEGYDPTDHLPPYRVIGAPLVVDGFFGNYHVNGRQLPPSVIPDFAREHISETVELRYAVRNLEAMLELADIRLLPLGGSDLAEYLNMTSGTQIVSLYWKVSHADIRGVLDQVRTALIRLVVELRANIEDEDGVPAAETTNQAVNVVISGKRSSVQVTTAQASGTDSTATATASASNAELSSLLVRLESVLRAEGDGDTAEKVSHVATLLESPHRDQTKLQKLWSAIKVAATTNEAVGLVARITPLLLGSGHHR